MEFAAKAKKIAEESFLEEQLKKKVQREKLESFYNEIRRIDAVVRERMHFVGKLFFCVFFYKKYKILFSNDDLSWHMCGHAVTTDIYINITVRFRDERLLYSLDYINDNLDQFKQFQINGASENCSAEDIDAVFLKIVENIARAKAASS